MESKPGKRNFKFYNPPLKNFLEDTTINGIGYIFKGESIIRRTIWSLFIIGCIIGCIVLIGFSVKRFIDKPTATTINFMSIGDEGVPFPAVTFCKLNSNKTGDNRVNIHRLIYDLFSPDRTFSQSHFNIDDTLNYCDSEELASPEFLENEIWDYLISNTDTIDNFVHYCGFSLGPEGNTTDCKDDLYPVLTSAGLCYTFGTGQPDQYTKHSGVLYGLKLILNIDQANSVDSDGNAGVKVVVHERVDIARPNLYGIGVPPGRNAIIGVRKNIEIDETSEAHCIDDQDLPFLPNFIEYSQFACLQNALLEQSNRACGCVIYSDPSSPNHNANIRNCTFKDSCCLIKEYATFNAINECSLPCTFTYYDTAYSYVSYPTGSELERLADEFNRSMESIQEDFLTFQVFIEDVRVSTSVTEYTFGVTELLSEIGGNMGLFLGISIVSILEVIILVLDLIKLFCCPKKLKEQCFNCEKQLPEFTIVEEELKPTQSVDESESTIRGTPL